jgi:hypothetical protein
VEEAVPGEDAGKEALKRKHPHICDERLLIGKPFPEEFDHRPRGFYAGYRIAMLD